MEACRKWIHARRAAQTISVATIRVSLDRENVVFTAKIGGELNRGSLATPCKLSVARGEAAVSMLLKSSDNNSAGTILFLRWAHAYLKKVSCWLVLQPYLLLWT